MVVAIFMGAFADDKWYLLCMAKYKGRTVKLNKVQRGDVKKFKVFVRNNKTGRVQKVNFGAKGNCNLDSELTLIVSLSFFIA